MNPEDLLPNAPTGSAVDPPEDPLPNAPTGSAVAGLAMPAKLPAMDKPRAKYIDASVWKDVFPRIPKPDYPPVEVHCRYGAGFLVRKGWWIDPDTKQLVPPPMVAPKDIPLFPFMAPPWSPQ